MDELIKITDHAGKKAVSARELHIFLESKQQFGNWITNRIKKYGLIENQDYVSFNNIIKRETGATTQTEYVLTLDCAKEISMVEGNAKGKQARQYFIACENKLKESSKKSIDSISKSDLARMILESETEKEQLLLQNKQYEENAKKAAPKVQYHDNVLSSDGLLTTTQIAKDFGWGAQTLNAKLKQLRVQYKQSGQWLLYSRYQNKGYTRSVPFLYFDSNTGLYKTKQETKWTEKGRRFIHQLFMEEDTIHIQNQMDYSQLID